MVILHGVALLTHLSVHWDWPKKDIGFAWPLASPVGEGMASPQPFSLRGSSALLLQEDATLTLGSAVG